VGFFPGEYGVRRGTLLVFDNAADSPQRVPLTAYAYPFKGMYTLDAFGVGANLPPRDFDLFSNSTPTTAAGFTLDGYGGIHQFGFHPNGPVGAGGHWPGKDLGISVRLNPTSTMATPFGWTMEGWGGFHAFNGGQEIPQAAYWNGWSVAVEFVVVR
jgi:hypothetical protein